MELDGNKTIKLVLLLLLTVHVLLSCCSIGYWLPLYLLYMAKLKQRVHFQRCELSGMDGKDEKKSVVDT